MRLQSPSRAVGATALTLALTACSAGPRAPSIPVFGSYFPAWIVCAVVGVILAVIVRAVLVRSGIDEHLPVPPLVYLCLAVSLSIGIWLFWSGML